MPSESFETAPLLRKVTPGGAVGSGLDGPGGHSSFPQLEGAASHSPHGRVHLSSRLTLGVFSSLLVDSIPGEAVLSTTGKLALTDRLPSNIIIYLTELYPNCLYTDSGPSWS